MNQHLPTAYLARYGETAWSISGQRTGLTDLPLTERGERNALCVLLFSSGHFLRVLAARWLGHGVDAGRFFLLNTASLSALSYEHNLGEPAIRLWDDARHVSE